MSQQQQEADLDAWPQTDNEGSNVLYDLDKHGFSLSDKPREWDQFGEIVDLPGTSYWPGQQADGRYLEFMSPLSGWPQDYSGISQAEQTGSNATEVEQSWLQHQDWEIDQFMQTFVQDVAQDQDLGGPHEPILMDPCPCSDLACIDSDEPGHTSQSLATRTQTNNKNIACPQLDGEVSNSRNMGGKLSSMKSDQTLTPKKCCIKRLDGYSFQDMDGNLVESLAMKDYKDAAAFIGCAKSSLSYAMRKTGEQQGIVFQEWKVEQLHEYGVTRLDGGRFLDTKGNFVNSLAVETFNNIAAFIGCDAFTISIAMTKTGQQKGIVLGEWKVERRNLTGADGGKGSVFPNTEGFWPEKDTEQDYMVFEQNPSYTYELEAGLSGGCSNYTTSVHSEQIMSHVPTMTCHHLQQSVVPGQYLISPDKPISMGQGVSSHFNFLDLGDSENLCNLLSMKGASSKDEESISQLLKDAIECQGSLLDEEHVRRHLYTPSDHHQSLPQSTTSCTSHVNNYHTEILKRGQPVKQYCVSQVDGHSFEFMGKTVSSVVICTEKAVMRMTGISLGTLRSAKKNVNVQWAQWKIAYIKRAHCNHVTEQGLLGENRTTLARCDWFEPNDLQSLHSQDGDSSHIPLAQTYSVGMGNQYGGYEAAPGPVSTNETTLEHNLGSAHCLNSAIGSQSSDIGSTVRNAKEAASDPKRKRGPLSEVHKLKLRNSALNHPVSQATRAKMSRGRANSYQVTHVNGMSFKHNGKQVTSARIWGLNAVGKLVGCTRGAISQALLREGEDTGIVKKVWKIRSLGKAHHSD